MKCARFRPKKPRKDAADANRFWNCNSGSGVFLNSWQLHNAEGEFFANRFPFALLPTAMLER